MDDKEIIKLYLQRSEQAVEIPSPHLSHKSAHDFVRLDYCG